MSVDLPAAENAVSDDGVAGAAEAAGQAGQERAHPVGCARGLETGSGGR